MVELNKPSSDNERYIKQLTEQLVNESIVLFRPKKSYQRVSKHFEIVNGVIEEVAVKDPITYFTYQRKSIKSFADVLAMLDGVNNQFAMLGEVKRECRQNVTVMRRLKNADKGVFDYRKQFAFFDLDHLEEIKDLADPTKSHQHAAKCIEKVQTYMPLAMRRASKIVRFSTSTGLKPNKCGMHMMAFFDEMQSEATLRALHKSIDRYMKRRIFSDMSIPKMSICDSKVATYNQPLYICPPVLGKGIKAPFYFRDRHKFIPGESQIICVADLQREIDIDDELYGPVKVVRAAKARSTEARQKAIREAPPAIYGDDSIIDLAFARSEKRPIKLAAFMEQHDGHYEGNILSYKRQCVDLYRCNVLTDAIALINAAGNLSADGDVNEVLTILVSLAVKKLPLSEITEERVIAITKHIAGLVFDDNDVAASKLNDWLTKRKFCSILSRALDAAAGNKIVWNGRKDEDRRYGYSQSRVRADLIEILGEGAEELIREHGLSTLFDNADKQNQRRRDKGCMTRDEYMNISTSQQLEREILSLSDKGIGNREIARIISDYWQVDLTESSVRRTKNRLRRVRTSTDTSEETACHSLSLEDVTHSLTSRTRDNEIVNITNTTDNLEDSCDLEIPCDLSFFDNPVEFNDGDNIIEFYSKCDLDHLEVQKYPCEQEAVVTASNNVIAIRPFNVVISAPDSNKDGVGFNVNDSKKTSVGHVDDVSYRYHVSNDLSEIIEVASDDEIDDGYSFTIEIIKNNVSFRPDPCMHLTEHLKTRIAMLVKELRVQRIDRLAA